MVIQTLFSIHRQSSLMACRDHHVIRFHSFRDYFSLLYHPKKIKSDGMRTPSWSFAFIVFETILVSFAIQRQSSLMACGDHHGHSLSLFSRLFQSHFPSKDNQVRWRAETIMVNVFFFQRQQCLQKATMPSFTFRRRQCLQKATIPSLLFEDNNVSNHCMFSKGNNVFIYISKMTMS